jgi:hypothetical protein
MRANQLVGRDAALASVMGAMGNGESDFGAEFAGDLFEDEFGDEFDDEFDLGDEDDDDDYGAEFAEDYGYVGGPRKRRSLGAARKALARRWSAMARTRRRNSILEPNKGSSVKVERYTFTLSETITLGTAQAFTTLSGQPDTTIRPQRLTTNAPSPMFAFIQEIKVANVSVSVGSGQEDAFNYNALGVGQMLDMPTLSPANRATILGNYTGFVPPGFVATTQVPFSVSLKGPSSIIA